MPKPAYLCSNMLQDVLWSLLHTKNQQSSCSTCFLNRVSRRRIGAGTSTSLSCDDRGHSPQVLPVTWLLELYAGIWEQLVVAVFLLLTSEERRVLPTPSRDGNCIRSFGEMDLYLLLGHNIKTHSFIQQLKLTSKCTMYPQETVQSWFESPGCSQGVLFLAFPVHFKAALGGDGHFVSSCIPALSTYSLLYFLDYL